MKLVSNNTPVMLVVKKITKEQEIVVREDIGGYYER